MKLASLLLLFICNPGAVSAQPQSPLFPSAESQARLEKRLALLEEWIEKALSGKTIDMGDSASKAREVTLALASYPRLPQFVAWQKQASRFVGRLTRLLDHGDPDVVQTALSILSSFGTSASSFAPTLRSMICETEDAELIPALFSTLLRLTPETNPVGPVFLKMLDRRLSKLSSQQLAELDLRVTRDADGTVESIDGPKSLGMSILAVGYALELANSGHTICEARYLVQAASSKYPSYIRVMAMNIMAELGEEFRSVAPDIRKLMRSEDPVIAYVAGRVLLYVAPGRESAEYVANRFGLNGTKRKDFIDEALSIESDEIGSLAKFIKESKAPAEEFKMMRDVLHMQIQYGNGFARRSALRTLRGVPAEIHRLTATIHELRCDPDPETRRLASELSGMTVDHSIPARKQRWLQRLRRRFLRRTR